MLFEKFRQGRTGGSASSDRRARKTAAAAMLARAVACQVEALEARTLLTAVVTTNQPDYAPGSTAVFTATNEAGRKPNFLSGETIQFHIIRTDGVPIQSPPAVVTFDVKDGVGGFTPYKNAKGIWVYPDLDGTKNGTVETNWYVDPQFAGAHLEVIAKGLRSGARATEAFTDGSTDTFSGTVKVGTTAISGVTVTVYSDSNLQTSVGTTMTNGSGAWSITTASGIKPDPAYMVVTPPSGDTASSAVAGTGGSPQVLSASEIQADLGTSGGTTTGNQFILAALTASTTTVASSANPSTYGQSVTFTATVTTNATGTVTFKDGSTTLGTGNLSTTGGVTTATYSTSALSASGSPHSITAVYGGDSTYAGSTSSALSQTVNKAALSITASAESKTYGQTVTFGSGSTLFTSSGLQNGETIGTVTLAVSNSGGAATAPVSGSYTITPSAATGGTFTAGNYTITYATGSLTVNKLAVTLSGTRTYDGTTAAAAGILTITNNIDSTNLTLSGSGTLSSANVGSPTISAGSLALGGSAAGNYTLTGLSGAVTITVAPLTITASAESKTYGQTVTFGTGSTLFTSSGLQNGETIGTVTLAVSNSGGAATAPVSGSYTITPSAATGGTFTAGNYTITYATGSLTVNKLAVTLSGTRTYDGTTAAAAGILTITNNIDSTNLTLSGSGTLSSANVGSPTISAGSLALGGSAAGNYTLTGLSGAVTITARALTITASAESKTYGQTVTLGTGSTLFTSSGLQNGETIGTVTLAVSNSGGAATAPVSGSYTITPSAATGGTFTAGNYTITYATGSLTVNKLAVTLSGTRTYDGTTAAAAGILTITNNIDSTNLTLSGSGTLSSANVGSPTISAGSLALGGSAAGNYTLTGLSGAVTITVAPLTITASAESKTYGQTVTFGSGSTLFTSSGLQNGETIGTVTLAVSNSGGAATAPVSGSYTITPSAATGGTFTAGNYTITYATGSLTVNKLAVTLSGTRTYDGTTAAAAGILTITNNIDSTNLTLSGSGTLSSANVGSPTISAGSLALGGSAAGNYTLTGLSGAVTITVAPLTITASAESKTYGQTVTFGTGSTLFTSSGLQNGETIGTVTLAVSNSGGAATAPVSGSYTITPSAATGGTFTAGNYTITYATGSLTVNKLAVTLSGTRTYDGTTAAAAGILTITNNIDSTNLTLSGSGTLSSANVGSPTISAGSLALGGSAAGNYTLTGLSGAVTITARALTITASAESKTYGQTVTFGTGSTLFTSSGLQNGETIGTVTLAVSNSGGAATAPVSGSYTITPSAATGGTFTAGNYTITYATGSLTVNKLAVTLSGTRTYDGTTAAAAGILTITNNIDSTNLTLSGSGTLSSANVGSPTISAGSLALGGSAAGNYTLTGLSGAVTITVAPLTITASAESKTYGQTVTFGTGSTLFTSSGLQNGETIGTVTLAVSNSGGAATAPVSGSYTITPSAATGGTFTAGNYTITYATGSLTVNKLAVTLSGTRTYDGTTAAAAGILTITNNIDSTNLTLSGSGTLSSANVGSPTISAGSLALGGSAAGNYTLTGLSGAVTITVAPLTITASAESKTYGQTVTFGTGSTLFTSSGLQNGETIGTVTLAVSNSGGAATAPVSGSYTITPSAATGGTFTAGNYTITYATGSLTVNKLAVTLSGTRTYDGTTAAAAGILTITNNIDSTNLTLSGSGTLSSANVGSPTISAGSLALGGSAAGNYTLTGLSGAVTITARALTITASAESKTYGQTVTLGTGSTLFTSSGLQNGETIGTVTLAVSNSGGAATAPVSGSYTITPSAATGGTFTAGNYTITYATGSLTVNKLAVTLSGTRTYDGTTAAAAGILTITNNIDSTNLTLSGSGTLSSANVGSPTISAGSLALGGSAAGNYTLTGLSGAVTITVAPLTITASAESKTYGQTVTFGTGSTLFTSSGLQNGETIGTVTLAVSNSGGAATAPVSGSPYTITPSAATGGTFNAGNYTITYNTGNLTVSTAALTVTASGESKTYGQTVTFAGTEFTDNGLVNSDTVTSVTLTSSGAAATATVSGSPYTITPSAAAGTGLSNYTITYNTGALTVNKAALSITANSTSKTYGQTVTFAGTEFTDIGLVNSDTVTGVTLASSGAAATASVSGSPYTITPSAAAGTGLSNYTITYNTGNLTVNKAALSITANSTSKTYGQTVTFAGTEFTDTGLVNSDTVTGVTLTSSGAAATATVSGSPYTITPSAATGTGLSNYTITYNTGTLTVNTAALTITANSTSKTYGQTVTFAGTEFTDSGLVNGDTVTSVTLASSGAAATAGVSGSPYVITASAAAGTGLSNYTITYNTGTLTVNTAALSITANSTNKTYGQTVTFAGTEFTDSGLVNGDTVTSVTLTSSGATAAAGVSGSPYAITASAATGSGLSNYTIAYNPGALTVNTAALSITANSTSKTYGQTITFAGTEFTDTGLVNSDSVTGVTLSSSGAAATASVSGSPYAITASAATGSGLSNYTITYNPGALTVNTAALSITANSTSKTYGQTVTFAGTEFTDTGLVNSDTVTSVTLTSSGAVATAGVSGSPYTITPSAAAGTGLSNYTITYNTGTLTVNTAALSITANSTSKTYGQTVTFAGTEFTDTGLVNSDTVTSVTLTSSGAAATATVSGSPYAITASAATGSGLSNYTISYNPGTLTVDTAALSITANSTSKTYGQSVTFAGTEFSDSGLVNGDTVTSVTLNSSGATAAAGVSGSPYTITPSAATGSGLSNYTITYNPGTLTVNTAALSITANSTSKTYGQTVTFAGTEFTDSGLVNSDTVTSVTLTSSGSAATASVSGSPYTITPSAAAGTGLSNYTITYNTGTLTVNTAALSITANSTSKTYGQTVTFAGTEFTDSGLVNSDTVTGVTLTSSGAAATAGVSGSPYTITPSAAAGTGLSNYTITYNPGTLTVNTAALSITANSTSKTYGQTVTFAGTEFTDSGLVNSDTVTGVTLTSSGAAAAAGVSGSPYTITPSAATGSGLSNYTITYNTGTLTVNTAALSITANSTSKTYGQTVTFAGTEFTESGLVNSDTVTGVTLTSSGAAATAGVSGSPYTITPSAAAGTGLSNYTITYNTGALTVNKAALSITANSTSKTYGQTATFAGTEFTDSGLLNSDTVTSVTLTSAGAAATATVSGSPYNITPSAATGTGLNNYTITYNTGSLTVNKAALTITANSTSKTYGQTVTFAGTEFTDTGLVNSDSVTSVTLTSAGAAATATVSGSPYNITPSAATGTGLNNYTITYNTGSLTVNKAALTVTANSTSKTYGQTVTFAGTEFTDTGLVNSDSVTSVTLTSAGAAATATVSGSPYTITPSAANGTGLGNYTITYSTGSLTVNKAALTITANSITKTYGTALTLGTTAFTESGLVGSDSISSVTLTSSGAAASASAAGSPYSIVPSAAAGTGIGNYTITYVNGTLTVSPLDLTQQMGVKYGGFVYNFATKFYSQALTITNNTGSSLTGNIALELKNLTSGVSLNSKTGTLSGNPYIDVSLGNGLANGASISVTLYYTDPTMVGIQYTLAILAGLYAPTGEATELSATEQRQEESEFSYV